MGRRALPSVQPDGTSQATVGSTDEPRIEFDLVEVSLTESLRLPSVRAAWKAHLPRTTRFVTALNRSVRRTLVVPPSEWVREERRWGCLGTAYDYLVGTRVARRSLRSVFERVDEVAGFLPRPARRAVALLKKMVRRGPRKMGPDYYRALGALADLDAMFRAGVAPPGWAMGRSTGKLAGLRAALRHDYPNNFVEELQALVAVTRGDLPRGKPTIYNPVFGGLCGPVIFAADGDLLVDDLLLDLKVSVELFAGDQVWQLLGYAALDRVNGKDRIRRVGLYNPRYRALWAAPLQDVLQGMGGTTWEAFYEWFQREATGAVYRGVAPRATDLR